jgi:hypothetical protein
VALQSPAEAQVGLQVSPILISWNLRHGIPNTDQTTDLLKSRIIYPVFALDDSVEANFGKSDDERGNIKGLTATRPA